MSRTLTTILLAAAAMLPCTARAQHATAFDVEDGRVVYARLCANCHGPDGNLIANIDLGRGLYRRDYTDAELSTIILEGITGTPMPANPSMPAEQAEEIVSFLRTRAMNYSALAITGDPSRGRALFTGKGECETCHFIAGEGSRLGPDLGNIGAIRTSEELADSLLNPASEVQSQNRFYKVTTRSGEIVRGRLLNHDTFTVQIVDENETLRSFDKASLSEHDFTAPGMPSVRGLLSDSEVADLVSYLTTLRN